MKKLVMVAMAVAFSVGVTQVGFAVAQEKKMEEKTDKKMDKKDMKKGEKMEKKGAKKMDKKDAANPCAAKADKK